MAKIKKKKMEFSKIWLLSCIIISLVFTTLSYILAFLDKNTVSELSQTIIETLWGSSGISFAFYTIQNGIRAYTGSKFGIPEKSKQKNKVEEIEIDDGR